MLTRFSKTLYFELYHVDIYLIPVCRSPKLVFLLWHTYSSNKASIKLYIICVTAPSSDFLRWSNENPSPRILTINYKKPPLKPNWTTTAKTPKLNICHISSQDFIWNAFILHTSKCLLLHISNAWCFGGPKNLILNNIVVAQVIMNRILCSSSLRHTK